MWRLQGSWRHKSKTILLAIKKTEEFMRRFRKIFFGMVAVIYLTGCKQPYAPPAIRSNPGWLVVDGFINTGPDSTIITLSRTRNLDSVVADPELNANLTLLGALSESYSFTALGNGRY